MAKGKSDGSLFTNQLRTLMYEKDVTQQEVADAVGVKRQSIAQYCDGSAFPTLQRLVSIADYFDVSLDYLLGRTDCKTNDLDIRSIHEKTGLSTKSISILQTFRPGYHKLINRLIESELFSDWADYGLEINALLVDYRAGIDKSYLDEAFRIEVKMGQTMTDILTPQSGEKALEIQYFTTKSALLEFIRDTYPKDNLTKENIEKIKDIATRLPELKDAFPEIFKKEATNAEEETRSE